MHAVVTGFDAFGGTTENPSALATSQLPDNLAVATGKNVAITKVILPTCCTEAWQALQRNVSAVVKDDERFTIIMAGQGNGPRIALERYALNVRDYRIPDNRGHQWAEEAIHKDGPDALKSGLDLGALTSKLRDERLVAGPSYHAGTFVCNETYYQALAKWNSNPNCAGIVFLHLPPVDMYGLDPAQSETQTASEEQVIEEYARAIRLTLEFIVDGAGVLAEAKLHGD